HSLAGEARAIFVAASWTHAPVPASAHWRARVADRPPIRTPIPVWLAHTRQCVPVFLPVPGRCRTSHASVPLQSRRDQTQTHSRTGHAPPDSSPARASRPRRASPDTLSGTAVAAGLEFP